MTGICPGKATRQRAFFYALKHLSLHINDKVQVPVFQRSTWKIWSWMVAFEQFPDLCQGLEQEDYDQVRLLLLSGTELDSNHNRKMFQKDTQAKATQAALLAKPEDILDLQRHVDEDARDVLFVAANRMDTLLRDKSHFLHAKSKQENPAKIPLIQQKRDLLVKFTEEPNGLGHRWQAFRSGVQCSLCGTRFHTKSLLKEIQEGLSAPCSQAILAKEPKKTRFEIIHDILDMQQAPTPGQHHFRLDKAYLRCQVCRCYILARAGEDQFNQFLGSYCHHGPLDPEAWMGHPTHQMWRTGNQAECQSCKSKTRLVGERFEVTVKLRQRCTKPGSQDLRKMFS